MISARLVVVFSFAVALATTGRAQFQPEATPAFAATYRAERVSVGSATVDLDFSARVFNIGSVDAEIRSIRLASPSSAVAPFAEFDGASIAAGASTDVSARVTISRQEWQRWEKGGPATLFAFVERASGDLGRTRIAAYREARPR